MRISRYRGVDIGDGMCDFDAVVSRKSKIVFEWLLRSIAGDVQQYIVSPRTDHVVSRGVPAPECTRKSAAPLVVLERYAAEAAARALGQLQERLGWPGMIVTCHYIGMVGASGVDIKAPRLQSSNAAFEWTIQALECEWKEEVYMRVRNCSTRPISLPSCTVTHVRLQGAALAAGQAVSALYPFEIRCAYPHVLS